MNEFYPIVYWPFYDADPKIVCYCKTKADAEEMILCYVQNQPYEDFLNNINSAYYGGVKNYLYNPLKQCDYFIDPPIKVLP